MTEPLSDKFSWNFVRYVIYLIIAVNLIALLISIQHIAHAKILLGDEHFYHHELLTMIDHGVFNTLADGTSTLLILPAYLLYKMGLPTVLSLKLVSFVGLPIFLFGLFLFFKNILKISGNLFWLALLTTLTFLVGNKIFVVFINDGLMAMYLLYSIYFLACSNQTEGNIKNVIISGMFFGFSLGVRSLPVLFLPGIVVYFLIQLFRKKTGILKAAVIFSLSVFITSSIIEIPSLWRHHAYKFEQKKPIARVVYDHTCNWTQLQYLTQLKVENGELHNHQHVDFAELEDYLKEHGVDSLPYTLWENITWSPLRTIREFFNDLFVESGYITIRSTGIYIFIFFLFLINLIMKKLKCDDFDNFLLLSVISLLHIATISFIVITYIEGRWYTLSLSLIIILGSYCLDILIRQKSKQGITLVFAQLLFTILSTGIFFTRILHWLPIK